LHERLKSELHGHFEVHLLLDSWIS
jgi:hypothetical protein